MSETSSGVAGSGTTGVSGGVLHSAQISGFVSYSTSPSAVTTRSMKYGVTL